MKVLKKLALSLMLICLCITAVPAINAQAAGNLYTALMGKVDAACVKAGSSVITSYTVKVRMYYKIYRGTSMMYSAPRIITAVGDKPEELYKKLVWNARAIENEYDRTLANYGSISINGYVVYGNDAKLELEDFDDIEVEVIVGSRSEVTRHYGLAVYSGTVPVAAVSDGSKMQISKEAVEAAFTDGRASYSNYHGIADMGGKDFHRVMKNITQTATTYAPIIKGYSSTDPDVFFSTFSGLKLQPSNKETLINQISAGGTVQMPFVCATLAMGVNQYGDDIKLLTGRNPWSISYDSAVAYFNVNGGGGGSLIQALLADASGASNGNLGLSTSTPMFSKYIYPYGFDTEVKESDFIFGVESTPKDEPTDWTKPDSTRVGKFTVNVMAKAGAGINVNSDYEIKLVVENDSREKYGPTFCVATPKTIQTKKVKGSDLASKTPAYVKFEVNGGSPDNPADDVLNKGELKISVTVSAVGGEPKQAMYEQSLSDNEATGSGEYGYNYVGWRGYNPPPPDPGPCPYLVPWAQHSASDPKIAGTLGANEYNKEDWDTGIGIPSTENVYVLAGGETALSDLAGYFVIHSSDGNHTEVSTDNQGQDEPGVGGGTPAVTREINVSCEVVNTWGWNNTLCERKAHGNTVSGGCKDSSGGGTQYSCTGHSGHAKNHGDHGDNGNCNGKSYGDQTHIDASNFGGQPSCPYHGSKWTASSGENHHYDGGHNQCTACNTSACNEGQIPGTCVTCNVDQNKTESPLTIKHDCTWSLTIYDGDKDHNVNANATGNSVVDLPKSFDLVISAGELSSDRFSIQNYVPGDRNDKGASFWKSAVVKVTKGADSTAQISAGRLLFEQQNNQYFKITLLEGTIEVWNKGQGKNPNTSGTYFGDNGPNGSQSSFKDEDKKQLPILTVSGLKCNGYSYGTGSDCGKYENCAHLYPHKYTLKYLERIDFYVFRTVTDAHLAAMRGSVIGGVNQVTRSGYDSNNGTSGAPIDNIAVGESSTVPESVGYLWRCINDKYGSYINGTGLSTDNGEYNGRILFEVWKDPKVGEGGALSYDLNTNFCLGNAEIKAVLQQDHEFGNNDEIKEQLNPTTEPETLPESMPDRGKDEDRYNHDHVTSDERLKDEHAREYYGKPGDCLNPEWQENNPWQAANETEDSRYKNIIIAEQNAVINFWQGKNKDDNYHANIISDNLCHGGTENTTQVIGEYYTVDDGIPLFNYLCGADHRNQIEGESDNIYRNHHSTVTSGNTKDELAMFIGTYSMPINPSMKEGEHFGYFGFGGDADGGDIPLADSLTGMCVEGTIYNIENGTKGWIPGPDVIDAYRRKLGSMARYNSGKNMSGITEFHSYLKDTPVVGGDSFSGYWADHNYPAHVPETIYGECNTSAGQSESFTDLPDFQFDGTNSGTLNQQQYGESLLMHNLPLIDWTPNGVWPTVDLSNSYGWLLDIESSFQTVLNKLAENGVYDHHKEVVLNGLGLSLEETLRIYDPMSAENSYNIGNQYGNFSDDESVTPDESDYDQRVTSRGKRKNDFAAIGNYVNTNTYLWTWIAPFGDFSSVGGSSGDGSDITTAEVHRNAGNHGYTNEMYIGTWTKYVTIKYPFVAKTTGTGDVGSLFNIRRLDNVYGYGKSEYMEAQYGTPSLQNFYTDHENPVFKYGNAVGARNTVNCVEGKESPVIVTAYAINDGIQDDDNNCHYGEIVNSSGSNTDKIANGASKTIPIDIVGQIGNLAIHDTTDFRFSTYFKSEKDSWLIDGIVHDTDEAMPVHILAAPKDILFQDASSKVYKHSTLGVTDLLAPYGADYGLGMAGDFGLLPLTPAYITVPEFKTDALRLGYKVFASIETIGNYQADHKPGVKYPTNYDQAQDTSNDTRDEYMDIISEYYLYDFDDGKFYAIDLWSGPEGAKQCIYSGSDRKVHARENSEPLYINMDEEYYRRNVSTLEDIISKKAYNADSVASYEDKTYTALMSGLEFIGYTGNVRLDTMDLTFCGSDAVQGIFAYNSDPDDLSSLEDITSQRWHFTAGLTSTTTPTVPVYSEGEHINATQVENAYRSLRNKHPHSVIIEFQNYIAKGSVWTLKYKGSLMNSNTIQFYSDPKDCPYSEKSHISTEYKGYEVYNPDTGAKYGTQKIDPDSTPLVAYEAYKSNSEDRTIAGTH